MMDGNGCAEDDFLKKFWTICKSSHHLLGLEDTASIAEGIDTAGLCKTKPGAIARTLSPSLVSSLVQSFVKPAADVCVKYE